MNIIQKQPNPSGAYPPTQSWSEETPPDTHYEITSDATEFFNGFIIPTIENDVVISFVCNTALWETWKSEQAEIPIPIDTKATALSAIEKATTIASLRTAMLNYIDVAGIG